ncbi:MAG: PAS domain-containing protein [Thermoflexibacter sp.]|jgi:PAS domain S-box-containing protein|nr:PAS domain-containing protein [Thermoflexibacter sp.]
MLLNPPQEDIVRLIPPYLLHSRFCALVITDLEGNYLFVNEGFKKQFEIGNNYLLETSFEHTIHTDDRHKYQKALVDCLNHPDKTVEIQVRQPEQNNGSFIWTNWECSLFTDENKEPLGLMCIGFGIAKAQLEKKKTRDFADKVENIINNITDGIVVLDRNWKFVQVNKAIEQIFNITFHDLKDKSLWSLLSAFSNPHFSQQFHKSIKENTTTRFEDFIEQVNRWLRFTIYPSPESITIFIRDVTEERKMREELRLSKNKLKAILDSTTDSNYLIAPDFTILSFNKRATETIRHFHQKEIKEGQDFRQYLIKGSENRFYKYFSKVLSGKSVKYEQGTFLGRNHKIWLEIRCFPVYDESGVLIGVSLNARIINTIKKTEQKLIQSENKRKAILDSTTDSNILIDPDFKILSFNKTAQQNFYVSFNHLIGEGEDIRPYIDEKRKEHFTESCQKALRGISTQIEIETNLGNQKIWNQIQYFPVYNHNHKIIGISVNIANIDDRKRAEELLKKTENMLEAIYDSSQDATALIDGKGNILYFNKIFNETVQTIFNKATKIGDNLLEYIVPMMQQEFNLYLEQAAQGKSTQVEKQYQGNWFRFLFFPVYGKENQLVGIAYNVRNITNRKRAEIAQAEGERRLKVLADNFPDGSISLIDKNLNFLYTGGAGYKKFDINPENLIGKPIKNSLALEIYNKIEESLPSVLAGNANSYEIAYDNKHIYIINLQPVVNENKDIDSFVLTTLDVTHQKNNEKKIIIQNEKLKSIAWQQSHEVRRPVANILGLVGLILLEEGTLDTNLKVYLEHLYKATQELDSVIHKIVGNTHEIDF